MVMLPLCNVTIAKAPPSRAYLGDHAAMFQVLTTELTFLLIQQSQLFFSVVGFDDFKIDNSLVFTQILLFVFLSPPDTLIQRSNLTFSRGPCGNDSYTQNTTKTRDTSAVKGAIVKPGTLVLVKVKKASFSSSGHYLRIKSVPKENVFKGQKFHRYKPSSFCFVNLLQTQAKRETVNCKLQFQNILYYSLLLKKSLFTSAWSPPLYQAIFFDCWMVAVK